MTADWTAQSSVGLWAVESAGERDFQWVVSLVSYSAVLWAVKLVDALVALMVDVWVE